MTEQTGRPRVRKGVTRHVIVTKRWAVKVPGGLGHGPVRGWLANRSEWRQRHRPDVARPVFTLGHFVLVFPAADEVGDDRREDLAGPWTALTYIEGESHQDEKKPSSWGRFGDRWLIVDFDRAWQQEDRGLVGSLYYGRQERLARRWSALEVR